MTNKRTRLMPFQIWILEKNGGSLVGGAIKLFQDKKDNPPPPRDPRLPPKPQGQTVGSFRNGLQTLPEAIGAKMAGERGLGGYGSFSWAILLLHALWAFHLFWLCRWVPAPSDVPKGQTAGGLRNALKARP